MLTSDTGHRTVLLQDAAQDFEPWQADERLDRLFTGTGIRSPGNAIIFTYGIMKLSKPELVRAVERMAARTTARVVKTVC